MLDHAKDGGDVSRWRLTVEYDGTPFCGWQRQANGPSVQQALEEAISGFCGEQVTVTGAGRTDTGVHAAGQVAHVDLLREATPATVRDALNHHLRPAPVAVLEAHRVAADFHARFSARARCYRYRILDRPAPPVLQRGFVWWTPRPLAVARMAEAAALLVGRHDFTSFRSTMCGAASPLKTIDALTVRRDGEEVVLDVRARSFLHNQVRIIAGTLARVGQGRWSAADVASALAARDRTRAGPTAPPGGLCLMAVEY